VKSSKKALGVRRKAKISRRITKIPTNYGAQWEILPSRKEEYRAAAIYEYSRESEFLLEHIFTTLHGPLKRGPSPIDDILGWVSVDLGQMVMAARLRKMSRAWTCPWVKLKKADREWLVASIHRPPILLNVDQVADLVGADPTLEVAEEHAESPSGFRFRPPSPPKSAGEDPRVFLPLLVDPSMTGKQLMCEIGKLIERLLTTQLTTTKGRGAKGSIWERRILDLAGLRLLSTRDKQNAQATSRRFSPNDWRCLVLYSSESGKMRVKGAREAFRSLFHEYDPCLKGSLGAPMISERKYKQTHPIGRRPNRV